MILGYHMLFQGVRSLNLRRLGRNMARAVSLAYFRSGPRLQIAATSSNSRPEQRPEARNEVPRAPPGPPAVLVARLAPFAPTVAGAAPLIPSVTWHSDAKRALFDGQQHADLVSTGGLELCKPHRSRKPVVGAAN